MKFLNKKDNSTNIIIIGLVLMLLIGLYCVCVKEMNLEQFVNLTNNDNEVLIVLFYTDWCGYCKKFKPEWQKAVDRYNGKTTNGKTVKFEMVNCDEEEELAKEYDIQGFPTVKILTNGSVEDFEGDRSLSGIANFIKTL